jgi:hypothetical protein
MSISALTDLETDKDRNLHTCFGKLFEIKLQTSRSPYIIQYAPSENKDTILHSHNTNARHSI